MSSGSRIKRLRTFLEIFMIHPGAWREKVEGLVLNQSQGHRNYDETGSLIEGSRGESIKGGQGEEVMTQVGEDSLLLRLSAFQSIKVCVDIRTGNFVVRSDNVPRSTLDLLATELNQRTEASREEARQIEVGISGTGGERRARRGVSTTKKEGTRLTIAHDFAARGLCCETEVWPS